MSNVCCVNAGGYPTYIQDRAIALANAIVQIPSAFTAENFSRAMHTLYSLDGFEKWTKALIADLKLLSKIPAIGKVFDTCIEHLEAQKDLYYATMSLGSVASYFNKDENGRWVFRPFTGREPWYDKVAKVLLDVGNFCETGKFLQKYKLLSFASCTQLSNTYGAVSVFGRRLDDIPVALSLFSKPKDFFLFFASGFQIYSSYWKGASWETFFKAGSAFGKMVLISTAKWHYSTLLFHVADFVTQNLSLFGLIYKRHLERQERFDIPAKRLNQPQVPPPAVNQPASPAHQTQPAVQPAAKVEEKILDDRGAANKS